MLQALRARGYLAPGRTSVEVADPAGPARLGEFNSAYLRLQGA